MRGWLRADEPRYQPQPPPPSLGAEVRAGRCSPPPRWRRASRRRHKPLPAEGLRGRRAAPVTGIEAGPRCSPPQGHPRCSARSGEGGSCVLAAVQASASAARARPSSGLIGEAARTRERCPGPAWAQAAALPPPCRGGARGLRKERLGRGSRVTVRGEAGPSRRFGDFCPLRGQTLP